MDAPRPARIVNPSAKLKDTAESAQLSFQRKVVQDFYSRQADNSDKNNYPTSSTLANPPAPANAGLTSQNKRSISTVSDVEDEIDDQPVPRMSRFCPTIMFSLLIHSLIAKKKHATATRLQAKSKRTSGTVDDSDVDMADAEENICANGMIF